MTFSSVPNFSSRRHLVVVAALLWAVACIGLSIAHRADLSHVLGDADDALRLTMVRDLAHGQGWFDQKLTRMQPPLGLYMHWSRLIDGGEAGLFKLFALVLPADRAEIAMRAVWPLLWLVPTLTAALLVARRLGGGQAVFLTAIAVALSVRASGQFFPGRIDHHNVQIACCLVAFAAAVRAPGAIAMAACGLASAAGLAVGLEALPFHAVIGAGLGLAWAFKRLTGRGLTVYGAALGLGAVALFGLQTPPARWLAPACDALATNLVAGLAVSGLGLAVSARIGAKSSVKGRIALLAGAGLAAGMTYLGLDPVCIHGPLADLDPELRRVWQAHVAEMTPWLGLARSDPASAVTFAAPVLSGLAGWAWLGRKARTRGEVAWILAGALLVVATAMTLQAIRSGEYAVWLSAPLIGAALADVAPASFLSRLVPAAFLVVGVNVLPAWLISAADHRTAALSAPTPQASASAGLDPCIDAASFRPLAREPAGLVLSETDAGPYILATSPHSVLQAPYHRMTWGMKQSRAVLGAAPDLAERRARALNIAYILNCPAHANQYDRASLPADGLQHALDQGRTPAWLQPLSQPGDALQLYRVRPAGP